MSNSQIEELTRLYRQIAEVSKGPLREAIAFSKAVNKTLPPDALTGLIPELQRQLTQFATSPDGSRHGEFIRHYRESVRMLASIAIPPQNSAINKLTSLVRGHILALMAIGDSTSDAVLMARKDDSLRKLARIARDARTEQTIEPLTAILDGILEQGRAKSEKEIGVLLDDLTSMVDAVLESLESARTDRNRPLTFDRMIGVISFVLAIFGIYFAITTPDWIQPIHVKLDQIASQQSSQSEHQDEINSRVERLAQRMVVLETELAKQVQTKHELRTRARVHVRPSGSSGLIAVLDGGAVVDIVERRGRWSKIQTVKAGRLVEGWIPSRAIY